MVPVEFRLKKENAKLNLVFQAHFVEATEEEVGPCVDGFASVSTVTEAVTVRVKDASSVVNAVPDVPRRTNCGRCAQCCVSVLPELAWKPYFIIIYIYIIRYLIFL